MIGQEIWSIEPYTTNKIAPKELIILKVLTFFIVKEIIKANDAKYPTNSVYEIPKIIYIKLKQLK